MQTVALPKCYQHYRTGVAELGALLFVEQCYVKSDSSKSCENVRIDSVAECPPEKGRCATHVKVFRVDARVESPWSKGIGFVDRHDDWEVRVQYRGRLREDPAICQ